MRAIASQTAPLSAMAAARPCGGMPWNILSAARSAARKPAAPKGRPWEEADAIALPFELTVGEQILSFITTTTVFGTPADVTLSELAVEAFFPANAETAAAMQAMAKARQN